jgi:hypothetical protein
VLLEILFELREFSEDSKDGDGVEYIHRLNLGLCLVLPPGLIDHIVKLFLHLLYGALLIRLSLATFQVLTSHLCRLGERVSHRVEEGLTDLPEEAVSVFMYDKR